MSEAAEMHEWGVEFNKPKISIDKVRARKEKVIDTLTGGLAQLAKRRNVRVINARGIFVDSQTLQLEGGDKSTYDSERLTFDHCILATGSVPAMPKMFKIDSPRVMDSTGALALEDIPETLLVIGGGYIGLEMGTVYAELGSKVTVVELLDGLLPGADRDLVKPLEKRLREKFAGIHLGTKVVELKPAGGKVEVVTEGPEFSGVHPFDRVLVSIGRRPSTTGIGLENTKVKINDKGFVGVNEQQQTADPHILAIGDVAGEPMLAHKASHEGKVAAEVLAGKPAAFEPQAIPAVVFTDPEIAWAGLTLSEAEKSRPRCGDCRLSLASQRPGDCQRPHGRFDALGHRSGIGPRARLWYRRLRRGRADRRSGRGHRNGLHGARCRRLDPSAPDAERNARLRGRCASWERRRKFIGRKKIDKERSNHAKAQRTQREVIRSDKCYLRCSSLRSLLPPFA